MAEKIHEVIIYGGAFNPPTLAHAAILQACVDLARERHAGVWMLPSGDRYDKTIPTPRAQRLAYVAAMAADVRFDGVPFQVITSELDREEMVETYDTVRELQEEYPEIYQTWVFGADSTETMPEWKMGQWILEELDKVVIERAGSTINPMARRVTRLMVEVPDVSSTEARQRIARNEPLEGILSPAVAALI